VWMYIQNVEYKFHRFVFLNWFGESYNLKWILLIYLVLWSQLLPFVACQSDGQQIHFAEIEHGIV
jgi:hypothetical protein